jgi:hypothetical protein
VAGLGSAHAIRSARSYLGEKILFVIFFCIAYFGCTFCSGSHISRLDESQSMGEHVLVLDQIRKVNAGHKQFKKSCSHERVCWY